MSGTINARIPAQVEQKLADYCARSGLTRSQAVLRALQGYLDRAEGGTDAHSLAADLIPGKGTREIQSENVRKLARKAFRGSRAR
jgi:hypothetical protein